MQVDSVLFYRYLFGALFLAIIMLFKKQSFAVKKREVIPLICLGLLFTFSSVFLFDSFNYMDAGIACTILFVYPVMVAIAMAIFFKERMSLLTYSCIALALVGVGMLYDGGDAPLNSTGMALVLLSALAYASYIIVVNKSAVSNMNAIKLTFWAILCGTVILFIKLSLRSGFQPIESSNAWFNIMGLAFFPTVISMILIAVAINKIGSTQTSIVGSLEPITALAIGVIIFNEPITLRIILGVILILFAVLLIVAGKPLVARVKQKASKYKKVDL